MNKTNIAHCKRDRKGMMMSRKQAYRLGKEYSPYAEEYVMSNAGITPTTKLINVFLDSYKLAQLRRSVWV